MGRASHIIDFILETLLPFDSKTWELLLLAKQCGIEILTNYLLSILDLPSDRLGISSVGISPISGNKTRSIVELESGDGSASQTTTTQTEESDGAIQQQQQQMMEETDPFNVKASKQRPISPEIECYRILDALFCLIRKHAMTQNETKQYQKIYSRKQKKKKKKKKKISPKKKKKKKKKKK